MLRIVPRLIVVATIAAGAAQMAHAFKQDSVPDWVQQAANATLPTYPKNAEAVKLYEESVYTVTPDGRTMLRYREAIKILRPQGREYSHLVSWYNQDGKVNYMHAWSIGADGHPYALNDKEIREEGVEGGGILYDNVRVKIATPPAADVNAVVAYEFEKQVPPYFSEQTWNFQESIPTRFSAIEFDLPPGWKYYAAWFHRGAVEPKEVAPNHLRWELQDVPEVDVEDVPLVPSRRSLAQRMVVHYAATDLPQGDARWAALGDWYDDLAARQTEGSSEVAAASRGIASSDQDVYLRLAEVAEFMQRNIRYVGIEIGIGGYKPHSAADVYHFRYGDCKDKVTLMISMLNAVGLRATWVLVDTNRGYVDPATPSIHGNHAIIAIELPGNYGDPRLRSVVTAKSGKRYLIFDPTDKYTAIGQIRWQLQGGYGILVAGKSSELIQLPKLGSSVDVMERSGKFELAEDGTLKGSVTENRSGMTAHKLRYLYVEDSEKQQREALESTLHHDFTGFSLGSQQASNAKDLEKQFVLRYDLTANSYSKSMGNLMLVRPRVLGTDAQALNNKARVYPIDLGRVGTWRDTYDVQLPSGYAVDDLPQPVSVDVGFASYKSKVTAEGNVLHYSREYVVKDLELEPQKYDDLKKLVGAITADEITSAVLKKQ